MWQSTYFPCIHSEKLDKSLAEQLDSCHGTYIRPTSARFLDINYNILFLQIYSKSEHTRQLIPMLKGSKKVPKPSNAGSKGWGVLTYSHHVFPVLSRDFPIS